MSAIEDSLQEYISIRRALGFKMRFEVSALSQFVRFLEKEDAFFITTDLAVRWATLPERVNPAQWANRLSMVRAFAQFHKSLDPRTEIPPQGLLPHRYLRKRPYIYQDAEILRLLQASSALESSIGLHASTFATLFGLLAVTGMRVSEPIALDRADVDFKQKVLTVRHTKFGKSRMIPLHPSTISKLAEYSQLRDQLFPGVNSQSFFLSENGKRLSRSKVYSTFVNLSCEIGLRERDKNHGPRLHDLRHTFAVKTLIRWYQEGVDVEQHMPELTTYLGHTHVNYTYWYISAIPELLELASSRLTRIYREGPT